MIFTNIQIPNSQYRIILAQTQAISRNERLTHIHGCLSASEAVMRLAGLTVSMLLMRCLASGVTVSHSGDGYWSTKQSAVDTVPQNRKHTFSIRNTTT